MFFYFIITMINAFQAFEQIYVMTRGDQVRHDDDVYYIYNNGLSNFRMGYAAPRRLPSS